MTTLVFTQPTNDPDPVTNPLPRPKPAVGRLPFVVLGLGAGLFLAAAGALWLMWGAA